MILGVRLPTYEEPDTQNHGTTHIEKGGWGVADRRGRGARMRKGMAMGYSMTMMKKHLKLYPKRSVMKSIMNRWSRWSHSWLSLSILLFLLPIATATIPQSVSEYCVAFNAQECNAHSSWSTIDTCKSMIKCVADVDMDTLAFRGCRTVLHTLFDDCKRYPSTLCYNSVAYDTSYSESCGRRDGEREYGARFRMVDACGNTTGFGPCLKLDTCDEVTVSPHTGASIVVHEGCEIIGKENASEAVAIVSRTMQEEPREEPRKIDDAHPSSSLSIEEDEGRARTGPQLPPQEITDSKSGTMAANSLPAREQASMGKQASDATATTLEETARREAGRQDAGLRIMATSKTVLSTGLATAIILLILFILYWYFW